jgi:hypothetical protein
MPASEAKPEGCYKLFWNAGHRTGAMINSIHLAETVLGNPWGGSMLLTDSVLNLQLEEGGTWGIGDLHADK